MQEFKTVDIDEWFPAERQEGATEGFYTALHEDFYRAYLDSGAVFCPHRVCPMGDIASVAGEHIHPYLTYLPGLADLLGRSGAYVPSWVREFYATVWIDPAHQFVQFTFRGSIYMIQSAEARSLLRIPSRLICLHDLCYLDTEPPRCPHSGVAPSTDDVRPCFREGSS